MATKVKIEVERFDEGITTRWYDVSGEEASTKSLATNGREHAIIGQDIWTDVTEIMDKELTDKVVIRIEYEAITQG